MKHVILALDIGGSKINGALVDAKTFRIIERAPKMESQPKNSSIMEQSRQAARLLFNMAHTSGMRPIACSAVVAGQARWPSGIVYWGSNIRSPRTGINMKAHLRRATGLPTTIDNDVHGFLAAELYRGAGVSKHIVVAVNLGTGIGGAIAVDGQILRGPDNTTGEFGHMTIAEGGRTCGDGMMGHFEAYASGTSMGHLYHTLMRKLPKGLHRVNARAVETLFGQNDPVAQEVVARTRTALATGLANIIVTLNPDCIIMGGGIARFKGLFAGVEAEVRQRLPFPTTCRILRTKLGDDAPLIGAALLTRRTEKLKNRRTKQLRNRKTEPLKN